MRQPSHPVHIGAKRKRVVSNNENAHSQGRSTRTKRMKTATANARYSSSTSDESESDGSEMEIDLPSTRWSSNDDSDAEEIDQEVSGDDEENELDSSELYPHSNSVNSDTVYSR